MSKRIAAQDYPFYSLIMAAMRQADTDNLYALERAFPEVWRELKYRYNSPGGVHPMDGIAARIILTDTEGEP